MVTAFNLARRKVTAARSALAEAITDTEKAKHQAIIDEFLPHAIQGEYSIEHRCDYRCWNAVGFICKCPCSGVNHGKGSQRRQERKNVKVQRPEPSPKASVLQESVLPQLRPENCQQLAQPAYSDHPFQETPVQARVWDTTQEIADGNPIQLREIPVSSVREDCSKYVDTSSPTILPQRSKMVEIAEEPVSKDFPSWRPGQKEVVGEIVNMPFGTAVSLDAPTGLGKSLTLVEAAKALRATNPTYRAVFLTGTKTLQDQYTGDFPDLVDFRGKGNYSCPLLDRAGLPDEGPRPCNSGWYQILHPMEEAPAEEGRCPVREARECPYYKQRDKFLAPGSITVTNYANYLVLKGMQKTHPDLLGCDEGHNIPQVIEGLSSIAFTPAVMKVLFEESLSLEEKVIPQDYLTFQDSQQSDLWDDWYPLFQKLGSYIGDEIDEYKARPRREWEREDLRRWSRLEDILGKTSTGCRFGGMLPAFEKDAESRRKKNKAEWTGHWTFAPILPGVQAPNLLYGDSAKVLVMSATLPKHMMGLIGLSANKDPEGNQREAKYIAMPPIFPPENSPITYGYPEVLPLVAEFTSNKEKDPEECRKWVANAVDAPLELARERGLRALVIVSSHNQVKIIQRYSLYSRSGKAFFHIWDGPNHTKKMVLERFKAHQGWGVLVAATDIAEGYSFAGDEVKCTIVAKLPLVWPTRTPMYAARSAIIKDYCAQEMALWLCQAVGRGTRTPEDTNLIILTDNRKQQWVGQVERFLSPHVRRQLTTDFPD